MGTREMEGNFLFGRVPYWPLVIAFVFWRLVMYCWARARNKGLTHWWGIFSLFSLFPNSRNATLGDIRRRTICILINLDASVSVVCSWGLQLYAVSRCTTRAPSWPSHKLSLSSLWSCKGEDESHPRLVDSASVSSDPTTVHHSSRDTKRPGSELKSIMDSAVLVGVWGLRRMSRGSVSGLMATNRYSVDSLCTYTQSIDPRVWVGSIRIPLLYT